MAFVARDDDSDARRLRASQLAERMPLVHFPVSKPFRKWTAEYADLSSRAARGVAIPPGDFEALRVEHVFTYAGPSCFHHRDSIGDSIVYFDPSAEQGRSGGATPFDSGSLEDPGPRLQPWATLSVEERWAFFQGQSVPLDRFRRRFAEWLEHAYDAPDRYLETTPDRFVAGEPDRLDPPELLEHNGRRGRDLYGPGKCGDRRAWTWEVRFARTLPFEHVRVLHVAFNDLEAAQREAERMQWSTGFTPEIETLPPELPADCDTLYQDSERVLRRLVG